MELMSDFKREEDRPGSAAYEKGAPQRERAALLAVGPLDAVDIQQL